MVQHLETVGKNKPNLIPCIKIYLRQIIDPNVKAKTVKLVEENIAFWSWGRKRFLRTQKALIIKENTDTLDFITIKMCSSKVNNRKRQSTGGEILKMCISDKRIIFKINTITLPINNRKETTHHRKQKIWTDISQEHLHQCSKPTSSEKC